MLLRHDPPTGPHHFDWLLDPDGHDHSPLLTFRVGERIDRGAAAFEAQRLADHRRRYLHYEGPLSRDRGSVRRVASGRCLVLEHATDRMIVRVLLGNLVGELAGKPIRGDVWRFDVVKKSWPEGEKSRGM